MHQFRLFHRGHRVVVNQLRPGPQRFAAFVMPVRVVQTMTQFVFLDILFTKKNAILLQF